MKEQPTKQHILISTINAIEKHGVHNLTTRLIAEEAGVNNAALHYYFGTKEELINEALVMTLQNWMEDTNEILSRPLDLRVRLTALLEYLTEGSMRYPNIIRAHLFDPIMNCASEGTFLTLYAFWLDRVSGELTSEQPGRDANLIRFEVHGALMGLLMAILLQNIPHSPLGLNIQDTHHQREVIDRLVETILDDRH
ncbi:MAG: TetR/AcrR family transcriptional regulator [Anaerolineae bacterium]|nr:TetR/AcrR family transcriptional regulator [Anaerolineae bacterium]